MRPLRLLGIPVHPLLVHFPVAGWTAATALAAAAAAGFDNAFAAAALYCNAIALATGALAMVAGFLELGALPENAEIRDAAANHMLLAASAWTLYLLMLILQVTDQLLVAALTGTAAFVLLMFAGHAGARLVYHHHLPVPGPRHG